jgi:hypothetical protein
MNSSLGSRELMVGQIAGALRQHNMVVYTLTPEGSSEGIGNPIKMSGFTALSSPRRCLANIRRPSLSRSR